MKLIDVEVKKVEVLSCRPHTVEHEHVIGNDVANAGVEPQRLGGAAHQIGVGDRVAAGKQRHLVPLLNQLVSQIGDDPLGTAIKSWRNTLHQRSNLRNSHEWTSG